jgi:peptidoglycan/LPS O-acetylase OafA/YrhL
MPQPQKNLDTISVTTKAAPHVFPTLDGLRGVASILVLIRHFEPFFGKAMEFQESFLAVDIFFLLSGAVISHAYERRLQSGLSVLHFAYIRVVRIYPLYILASTITLLVILSGMEQIGAGHLLLYSALALLMLPNLFVSESGIDKPELFPLNFPAWSLFFELAVNIFYAAVLRFLTTRTLIVIMSVSALGLIAFMYFSHAHNLDIGWTVKSLPGGFFRVGYSFFAGVFLYRRFTLKRAASFPGRHSAFIPYAILLLGAIFLMAAPSGTFQPYFDFVAVVVVFPVIVYLGLIFQPKGVGARIFKFFGLISYAVYVIHGPLAILSQGYLRAANGISVEHHVPWAGLDFEYNYAPWAGLGFLVFLLPFCWWLDQIYDVPLRRFLLGLWPSNPDKIHTRNTVTPPH